MMDPQRRLTIVIAVVQGLTLAGALLMIPLVLQARAEVHQLRTDLQEHRAKLLADQEKQLANDEAILVNQRDIHDGVEKNLRLVESITKKLEKANGKP